MDLFGIENIHNFFGLILCLQLFNSEDMSAYDLPALTDASGSVATVQPGVPSPSTNVALSEYDADVDLSEFLEMPTNGKFEI